MKQSDRTFRQLVEQLNKGTSALKVKGLQGSARSLIIARLLDNMKKTLVVFVGDEKEAKGIHQDLVFFLGRKRVCYYPSSSLLVMDMFAQERDLELIRMGALYRLLNGEAMVLVIAVPALVQKTIPKGVYIDRVEMFSCGSTLDRERLISQLDGAGYRRVSLVEEEGQFSVRGNIIDLFPPIYDNPFRLELVGDELESIREFDPATQRSTVYREEVVVPPASEVIYSAERKERAVSNVRRRANELELPSQLKNKLAEALEENPLHSLNPFFLPLYYGGTAAKDQGEGVAEVSPDREYGPGTIFDYLPKDSILILVDPGVLVQQIEKWTNDVDHLLMKADEEGGFYLERTSFALTLEEVRAYSRGFQRLLLEGLSLSSSDLWGEEGGLIYAFQTEGLTGIKATLVDRGRKEGMLAPLAERIRGWLSEGELVCFLTAGQEEGQRIFHLLSLYNLPCAEARGSILEDLASHNGEGRLILRTGHLTQGFRMTDMQLVILSEEEVFGEKTSRRPARPAREGVFLKSFGDLKEGDFVVHKDHGIGIYRGLKKLTVGDLVNDFLLLEYLDNDKLYIPVDRIAVIQRYVGPEGYQPRLDKLGGTSWETTKKKVKDSIREVAEELVALYATREVTHRLPFSPVDGLYEEFCSTFEYEETPDQAKAIGDVIRDMDEPKPMDRLICGDAGFGKTEVALRAAFRAVMDGKQVALLAPTTILAEQHYQTFRRRFENFPVLIGVLNRFKTKRESKDIIAGLAKGMVDIVIGTHRLLQQDVNFKRLGLLIIDEEHRFGVAHKEKLKKMRTEVDVLTLSATPIPRTLHLSLVGIRDLSIITTPPAERLPIKTYVLEFSEEIIREAIRRELGRGGQVFFVHDRIHSIYSMARLLQRLTPEARLAVVHGRMTAGEIEEVMGRFVKRDCDVLVCTSIIGSGIDIPSANTIIINRADRFGLAQLYQLRGRVGRARVEAVAYMLLPRGAMLSSSTRKRLQAIEDLTQRGAGFKIASHDLEIRGAGNILGTSQSGHISAIGYELYVELMEKTIAEMRGEPLQTEELDCEISLGVAAYIPEHYISDMHKRLITYKRISLAKSQDDLREIREEMRDCFGPIPAEVNNLLHIMEIKIALKDLSARRMGYDKKQFYIFFDRQSRINPERILALSRQRRQVRLTPDFKLYVHAPALSGKEVLKEAEEVIQALSV